jgi:uncharacterized protein (TIRG00374 family)
MSRKRLFNLLRVAVSLGLLALLLWMMRGSFGNVRSIIRTANHSRLAAAFLACAAGIVLLGVRLRMMMKVQGVALSVKRAVFLTFIGHFFNIFLPTAIGGDVVKAYYASKHTSKKMHAVTCVLMDRVLGTITIILMLLTVSFFVSRSFLTKAISSFLIIAGALSIAAIVVIFSKRVARRIPFRTPLVRRFGIEEKMRDLYGMLHNYRNHPILLFNAVAISVLLQVFFFYGCYLTISSMNFSVPFKTVLLFMPIISTMSMAPSINGLGVRESSFVFFFGPLVGKEGAFALAIMWLAINVCLSFIGGILYLFGTKEVSKT